MKRRVLVVGLLFVAVLGLVIWRLVTIQIIEHPQWESRAKSMQQRTVKTQPKRGKILDRQGRILAFNRKAYSIAVDSYNMTKPEALIDILGRHLDQSKNKIRSSIYKPSYFTWIDRGVDYQTATQIQTEIKNINTQGLIFIDTSRRVYPRGELGGTILGFTGIDGNGLAGIEYSMDSTLNGSPPVRRIMYGADRIPYRETLISKGHPGRNVYLTIDSTIQHIAQTEIKNGVKEFKAKRGWAVVMDPMTGEIFALAQDRQFNPNQYEEYPPARRKNWSVSRTFEPGSILKAFTALAALEEGVVTPDTLVNGNSPITISGHNIHNAQYRDWGTVKFEEVLKHSINTGMIRVAEKLGERNLYNFLTSAGFGRETGLELASEESGKLRPLRDWSKLAIGSVPIGQSISVTAVQLASRMAAIANGGNLVQPTLIEKVENREGELLRENNPMEGRRLASPSRVEQVKDLLRKVVGEGTGQAADLPGLQVCGKTGTAQKASPGGGYYSDKYISSFAGFFPKEFPQYLILVVLDEVGTSPVWGGDTAGVVFKNIATRLVAAKPLKGG